MIWGMNLEPKSQIALITFWAGPFGFCTLRLIYLTAKLAVKTIGDSSRNFPAIVSALVINPVTKYQSKENRKKNEEQPFQSERKQGSNSVCGSRFLHSRTFF
jgi:hypothetical protein